MGWLGNLNGQGGRNYIWYCIVIKLTLVCRFVINVYISSQYFNSIPTDQWNVNHNLDLSTIFIPGFSHVRTPMKSIGFESGHHFAQNNSSFLFLNLFLVRYFKVTCEYSY